MTKDLLRQIRARRAGKRQKVPFRTTLYTRVGCLVARHRLDESFLRALETPKLPCEDAIMALGLKPKDVDEPHLFSLCTEEEHRLTLAILAKVKNPFLQYATSPDEILMCGPLFRMNPSLTPETLMHHHFETLFLAESARRQIEHLTARLRAVQAGQHRDAGEESGLTSLAERLQVLRTFLASVEDAGSN